MCIGYRRFADCLLAGSGWNSILIPLASSQHNLYYLNTLLCVQCQTPDDGQIYCPKHVESYCKNKFEKLVLLVGFIIGIYHELWSSECQIHEMLTLSVELRNETGRNTSWCWQSSKPDEFGRRVRDIWNKWTQIKETTRTGHGKCTHISFEV